MSSESIAPDSAEVKRYAHLKLAGYLVSTLLEFALLALLAFVIAQPLDAALTTYFPAAWLRLAALFVVVGIVQAMVGFPLSLYLGYILEHQFGMSRQHLRGWLRDYVLKMVLSAVLGLALVEAMFFTIWYAGVYWWLIAAAGTFVLSVVLGQLAPVVILPLFFKIRRVEDGDLLSRFERLAQGSGLKIEGVYRMALSEKTVKANAMLAGLGATRRVILGDTLLDRFEPAEIEVVLAHEIGHHVFRHLPKLLALGAVTSLAAFFVCDRVLALWVAHQEGSFDYAQTPVYALPLLALTMGVVSLLISPLKNALMRHFERQCDRYALDRTKQPAAYRAAFSKLAQQNKSQLQPHWLEVALLHDHPPIAERIAMAEE